MRPPKPMLVAPIFLCTVPVLIAACTTTAAVTEAEPFYVRHSMQTKINPAIVKVWGVGNSAMDENGSLDPAQMTDDLWNSLAEGASDLAAEGEAMAAATNIRAASPGNLATGEYEIAMQNIQGYLDSDPQGFRSMAAGFAQLARSLEQAANARDVESAGDLVAQMDTECSVCHARYWYAEAE